jgi:hypothetical protein
MARAALSGRLTWQLATVVELVDETARSKSVVLDLPARPGHRAGQLVHIGHDPSRIRTERFGPTGS